MSTQEYDFVADWEVRICGTDAEGDALDEVYIVRQANVSHAYSSAMNAFKKALSDSENSYEITVGAMHSVTITKLKAQFL